MPSKMRYGTRQFDGLDTQSAPHLLGDGVLTQADNVNYDQRGAVASGYGDTAPANIAAVNINGIGVAQRDGTKYYYKVTSAGSGTVYEYDASGVGIATDVSGTWGDEQLRVVQLDDEVILYDEEAGAIWDGTVLRDIGPLTGTDNDDPEEDFPYLTQPASAANNIADITVSSGVVTVETSSAHGLSTGDRVYVSGAGGATQINGRVFTVTVPGASTDTFTLDDTNGSTWDAYTSGGAIYPGACGLDGDYFHWVSYTVTLPSGKEIESTLTPIPGISGDEQNDLSPTSKVAVYVNGVSTTDVSGYAGGSYTIGTDLTVSANIYRSKASGATPYLVGSVEHSDLYNQASGYAIYYDTTPDAELGAAFLTAVDSHSAPPVFSVMGVSSGRAYGVKAAAKREVYFSMIGEPDYWLPTDFVTFPEEITALGNMGDYLVVMSKTRCWLYDNNDGIGFLRDVPIQAGVSSQDALVSSDAAVYFANDVGLWALSGGRAELVSGPVRDDWKAAGGGTWSGAVVGDRMLWTCDTGDSDKAFTLKMDSGGVKWGRMDHDSDGDYELFAPDPLNDRFFVQRSDGVYFSGDSLSSSDVKTMSVKTKLYGDGGLSVLRGVVLDVSGDISGDLNVVSNYGELRDTMEVHGLGGSRRLIRFQPERLQGEYWQLEFVGTGTIYGLWFEVGGYDSTNP